MTPPIDRLLAILHLIYACATVSSFLLPKDEVIIDHQHPSYRRSSVYQPASRDARAAWSVSSKRFHGSQLPGVQRLSVLDELKSRWLPYDRNRRDVGSEGMVYAKRLKRKVGLNTRGSYATLKLHNLGKNHEGDNWHLYRRDVSSGPDNQVEHQKTPNCKCEEHVSPQGEEIALQQRASWLNMKRNQLKPLASKEVSFGNVQNKEDDHEQDTRASWMSVKKDVNNEIDHQIQNRASWLQVKKSNVNQMPLNDQQSQVQGGVKLAHEIQQRANWMQMKKSEGPQEQDIRLNNRANWLPIKKSDTDDVIMPQMEQRASWLPVKKSDSTHSDGEDHEILNPVHNIQNRASWMNVKKNVINPVEGDQMGMMSSKQQQTDAQHEIAKRATWIPMRDLSNTNTVYTKPTRTKSRTQHFINGRSYTDDEYDPDDTKTSDLQKRFYQRMFAKGGDKYKPKPNMNSYLSATRQEYSKRMPTALRSTGGEYGDPYSTGYLWNNKRAMWLPTRDVSSTYESDNDKINSRMPTQREIYQRMPTYRELYERMPTIREVNYRMQNDDSKD